MGKCVIANQVCPETSNPAARRYCPAWWETTQINDKGEVRTQKCCAWIQLPIFLNDMARTSAGAMEASQQTRNEFGQAGANFRALAMSVFAERGHHALADLASDAPRLAAAGGSDAPADLRSDNGSYQQSGAGHDC